MIIPSGLRCKSQPFAIWKVFGHHLIDFLIHGRKPLRLFSLRSPRIRQAIPQRTVKRIGSDTKSYQHAVVTGPAFCWSAHNAHRVSQITELFPRNSELPTKIKLPSRYSNFFIDFFVSTSDLCRKKICAEKSIILLNISF